MRCTVHVHDGGRELRFHGDAVPSQRRCQSVPSSRGSSRQRKGNIVCTTPSRHEPLDELVRGGPARSRLDESPYDGRREGQISSELSSKLSRDGQPQPIRIRRADDLELQPWDPGNQEHTYPTIHEGVELSNLIRTGEKPEADKGADAPSEAEEPTRTQHDREVSALVQHVVRL
jgi:hypothetical protein